MTPLFTLSSDVLPATSQVAAFSGREALSELYRFEIDLVIPHADGEDLDMAAAMDSEATLTVCSHDGTARASYHGILAELEFVHTFAQDAVYRAVLVPRFWHLTQTRHSRIFVQKSVPDIITTVLKLAGLQSTDWDLRLNRTYQPLDHVCMYRESYFDFLARWMEREGIYYWFEQGDSQEKLVISDSRSAHQPLGEPVRYTQRSDGDVLELEAMHTLTCAHRSLPARMQLRDYNYLRPEMPVAGNAPVSSGTGEMNLFGENFTNEGDGRRLAGLRAQELQARQVVYEGTGHLYDLRPGYTFTLEEHPRSAFDRRYVTTQLEHRGRQLDDRQDLRRLRDSDGDAPENYRVKFTAIADDVQFRPARTTEVPRIYGTELGMIDGAEDHDFAQIDEHGRYLVKVLFDESDQRNGGASMRIRMLQPHGGNPEGFHFPLRKATEVMLTFLGGDPDRPVIVGVVPNTHTPSVVTEDNHQLNVIHTGGNNHIEISDKPGREYIKFKTPHGRTMFHIGARHNPTAEKYSATDGSSKSIVGVDQVSFIGHSRIAVVGQANEAGTNDLSGGVATFKSDGMGGGAVQTSTVTDPAEQVSLPAVVKALRDLTLVSFAENASTTVTSTSTTSPAVTSTTSTATKPGKVPTPNPPVVTTTTTSNTVTTPPTSSTGQIVTTTTATSTATATTAADPSDPTQIIVTTVTDTSTVTTTTTTQNLNPDDPGSTANDPEGINPDKTLQDIKDSGATGTNHGPVPPGSDIKLTAADYWSYIGANRVALVNGSQYTYIGPPQPNATAWTEYLSTPVQASFSSIPGSQYTHVVGHQTAITDGGKDVTVSGGQTSTVTGGQTSTITGGQTSTVNGTQTTQINGHKSSTVTEGQDSTISGGQTSMVWGGQGSTVNGGKTSIVNGGQTSTIGGFQMSTVNGSQTSVINGPKTSTVTGMQSTTIQSGQFTSVTGGQTSMVDHKVGMTTGLDMGYTSMKISACLMALDDTLAKIQMGIISINLVSVSFAVAKAHIMT